MKTRIKTMLTSFAMLAVVVTVSAQDSGPRPERSPEQRGKAMVERMAEKLDLTADQQQQILDLHKELATRGERPERPAVKDGERPSKEEMDKKREEMRTGMQERRAEMESRMQEILSPEQFAAWKEEMGKMHRGRPEARVHDRKDSRGHKRGHGKSEGAGANHEGGCNCKGKA